MAKITYTNKVALSPQPGISAENKVTDADMNEIKTSVNTLYDNVGDITTLDTPTTTNVVAAINSSSIVESGSNSNGAYIKYGDGTMICYKTVTGSTNINSSWGSGYYGGDSQSISLGSFPQTFIAKPSISISCERDGQNYWAGSIENISTSSAGNMFLLRFSSGTSVNYTINIIAIGKWK